MDDRQRQTNHHHGNHYGASHHSFSHLCSHGQIHQPEGMLPETGSYRSCRWFAPLARQNSNNQINRTKPLLQATSTGFLIENHLGNKW
ncbi:MAG TPA: hypothetical protein DD670_07925 [Planctomycetaceae bacterium]|nr:hypothetical protein [Planctomycetaceae bacterium]